MATFEDAWKACGGIISGTEFREKLDAFVDRHCEQFCDDEENKLEYTDIHEQYESLIEEKLQAGLGERLGSSFDWEGFLTQLPDHIQKMTGSKRRRRWRRMTTS